MDIVQIERDLTAYFAEIFNLKVDKSIFRGSVPAGKSGLAVIVDTPVYSEIPHLPLHYNVQLLGTYADRDSAMRFLAKAWDIFPVVDIELPGSVVKRISTRGSGTAFQTPDGGKIKWQATLNLFAVILTTGKQI